MTNFYPDVHVATPIIIKKLDFGDTEKLYNLRYYSSAVDLCVKKCKNENFVNVMGLSIHTPKDTQDEDNQLFSTKIENGNEFCVIVFTLEDDKIYSTRKLEAQYNAVLYEISVAPNRLGDIGMSIIITLLR